MMAKRLRYCQLIITLLWSAMLLSCKPTPTDCKAYFDLSPEKRREFALANSVEKNFDLLRCRNYIEGFSGPRQEIIEGGEKNVPFLLSKMNESKSESEQDDAIYLLSSIDQDGRLPNRNAVMADMEQIISHMKSDQKRNSSTDWLNGMKERR